MTPDEYQYAHDHVFGQDQKRAGESRTLLVVVITAVTMVVEIAAGIVFGSMALLADGLHMASHAAALGIAVIAYVVSRRLAADRRFSFGIGKLNSLAGYTSAVILLGFALLMVTESIGRLIDPVTINFDRALWVAVLGLVVNGGCAWILMSSPGGHDHAHGHSHSHHHGHDHHHDHNLRAAYLHVLADALTSLLAIGALLSGKYLGTQWMDPAMGIVGAVLVTRWSLGLIAETSTVLLDHQVDDKRLEALRDAVAAGDDQVTDLHCWSIGHGIYAAEITISSPDPATAEVYRARIPAALGIVHATVEIRHSDD